MEIYHYAWLSAHPDRDEIWLQNQLSDGFDVHHLDADHSNNEPSNLVLIECRDHMRLHGGGISRAMRDGREKTRQKSLSLGKMAYEKKDCETSWESVGKMLNAESIAPASWARSIAKKFAEANSLPFPKDGTHVSSYPRLKKS